MFTLAFNMSAFFTILVILISFYVMTNEPNFNNAQEPITEASPEVHQILERTLQVEKDKIHLKTPRNINEDILKIIKEVIQ
ncbi:MAG: hypothetical protein BRC45_13365 [Cyanobacteria bacterium QS_5_48_63]|nr:MAG: hypothetical protein BRC45_13365 [Cyanobacteria bacterium QS_5_48_63]